jgi:glycosyltransferase involved in cell wall biosynthesis
MYSALILAKNERENIVRCLESLHGCDDVVVLDSGSTDGTHDAAVGRGARVFTREFDTFADQRNWAIDTIPFAHAWVLHLDADECLTPALHDELLRVTVADAKSAYFLANKLIFLGSWIRRSSLYPYYQARLLRLGESRFEQIGHGQHLAFATRGSGRLREPYLHYNFSKGIADWVERHNRYSSDEAHQAGADQRSVYALLTDMARGKSTESRQQAKKLLADRVPFRPFVRFLYSYIWRGGFLDGRAGFHYCMLMAFYDYLTRLKRREFAADRRLARQSPVPSRSESPADAD